MKLIVLLVVLLHEINDNFILLLLHAYRSLHQEEDKWRCKNSLIELD